MQAYLRDLGPVRCGHHLSQESARHGSTSKARCIAAVPQDSLLSQMLEQEAQQCCGEEGQAGMEKRPSPKDVAEKPISLVHSHHKA